MKKVLGWGATFALSLFLVVAGQWNAPAEAAVSPVWHANASSTINADGSLTMTGGNTSVETTEEWPGMDVEAGTMLGLAYTLGDGATCIGGAPRVFATVDGVTVNSWDQGIGTSVEEACKAVVTLPAGKVTALGVVWDNGQEGTITVKGLTGQDFNATVGEPDPEPSDSDSPSPSPSASDSPSPTPTTSESASPSPSQSSSAPAEEPTGEPSESTTPPTSVSPTASESETVLTPVDNSVGGSDLPVTGSKPLLVGGIGGLLVAVGGLLFIWARKRREA